MYNLKHLAMKKTFTLLLFSMISIVVHAQNTEIRSFKNFNKIKVSGGITVELMEGEPSAEIEIIKGELDELKTVVVGDVLQIKFDKGGFFNWNNSNNKAYIKLKGSTKINEIDASAGAFVGSEFVIKGDALNFEVSSGASIELEVEAEDVGGIASSGGSLKLNGSSKFVAAEASSGGTCNAKVLKSREVEAKASSGGSVSVWATDSIIAKASSGGSISYRGNPKTREIETKKHSGGNIRSID